MNKAHRLGARPDGRTPDTRNIIVKLCRRETKRDIITTGKETRDSNLCVNEIPNPTRRIALQRYQDKIPPDKIPPEKITPEKILPKKYL